MNKTLLVSICVFSVLLSPSLVAQTAVNTAIEKCRTEQNALKRLVCYDEITLGNTATNRPAATATVAAEQHIAKQPATSEFGREHKQPDSETADKMSATVSKITYSPRREMIITFDNGQVWRQTAAGTYMINVGERHYIKRGMFGSFYLGNDNNNRTLKVSREN